jgi:hypothetical protein
MVKEIVVDGVTFRAVEPTPEHPVVIVRSAEAGVFFGELVTRNDATQTVTLRGARRLWYWDGAASLSQLATEGTAKPGTCKFPAPTEGEHVILGVCEIIPTTERARKSIDAVKPWSAR